MVGTNVCRVCESSAKSGHGFPSGSIRGQGCPGRVESDLFEHGLLSHAGPRSGTFGAILGLAVG
eukprot:scaffold65428_cov57-Phaeocystis_antarctica.AAC.3